MTIYIRFLQDTVINQDNITKHSHILHVKLFWTVYLNKKKWLETCSWYVLSPFTGNSFINSDDWCVRSSQTIFSKHVYKTLNSMWQIILDSLDLKNDSAYVVEKKTRVNKEMFNFKDHGCHWGEGELNVMTAEGTVKLFNMIKWQGRQSHNFRYPFVIWYWMLILLTCSPGWVW